VKLLTSVGSAGEEVLQVIQQIFYSLSAENAINLNAEMAWALDEDNVIIVTVLNEDNVTFVMVLDEDNVTIVTVLDEDNVTIVTVYSEH
jgi:hypothetical protein